MNAEIFEKKEYSDSVSRVDFVRICQLEVDDKFMWQGCWFCVYRKNSKGIYYKRCSNDFKVKEPFGLKNQMFVQVKN